MAYGLGLRRWSLPCWLQVWCVVAAPVVNAARGSRFCRDVVGKKTMSGEWVFARQRETADGKSGIPIDLVNSPVLIQPQTDCALLPAPVGSAAYERRES